MFCEISCFPASARGVETQLYHLLPAAGVALDLTAITACVASCSTSQPFSAIAAPDSTAITELEGQANALLATAPDFFVPGSAKFVQPQFAGLFGGPRIPGLLFRVQEGHHSDDPLALLLRDVPSPRAARRMTVQIGTNRVRVIAPDPRHTIPTGPNSSLFLLSALYLIQHGKTDRFVPNSLG